MMNTYLCVGDERYLVRRVEILWNYWIEHFWHPMYWTFL